MRGSRSASERLAHGVEEPLPHLSRLALAATQLLVHAALLMAQVGRHHHSDDADLIAAPAAAGADLALTGQAQRHVVVDAGRDGDLHHAPLLDATLAAAMGARIVDDVALAAAVRARGHVGHLAEDRLHGATHLTGTST